jgi:hypothetical protein
MVHSFIGKCGGKGNVKRAVLVIVVLPVAYRRGAWGVQPPLEIPKALQNRAKLNPIVKTVKNC